MEGNFENDLHVHYHTKFRIKKLVVGCFRQNYYHSLFWNLFLIQDVLEMKLNIIYA